MTPADEAHTVTLATAPDRDLSKQRHANGTVRDYDRPYLFNLASAGVNNIAELEALLRDLLSRADTCVLRGRVLDPARTRGVRRLVHPRVGAEPTMADAARSWIALDIDGLPLPADTDPRDLMRCGETARALLPAAFRGAACIVFATAGHGFKAGARLRLWFLLSSPLSGVDCRQWLRDYPADPSVFGAVQPIYTAAPTFIGMPDPLPSRLVMLDGAERVSTPSPAILARPRVILRPAAGLKAGAAGAGHYALRALARAYVAIAGAQVGQRHPTAVSEAWALSRLVVCGLLSFGEMARTLDAALQEAGKPEGEGAAIAAWALDRRRGCCA
jgi:hypothetical protein